LPGPRGAGSAAPGRRRPAGSGRTPDSGTPRAVGYNGRLTAAQDLPSIHVTAIIAAAGAGRRLGGLVPKQLLEIGGRSILQHSVDAFLGHGRVTEVVVVLPRAVAQDPPAWMVRAGARLRIVEGGERRQDSVANAFDRVDPRSDVVLVHDAARPFVTPELISRSIDAAAAHGAAIVAVGVADTVKRVDAGGAVAETLPRETIYLAQTPQAFRRSVLADAIALGRAGAAATDEAMLAEQAGHRVHVIRGDTANVKITTAADLDAARRAVTGRIGAGYDLHRLVEGRPLILGGVRVPSPCGALGHSDADVVCHAATDAILGAAALGDIGRHFPDTDPAWKDASSLDLLRRAAAMARDGGFEVVNLDVVVVLERPKIAPLLEQIRAGVAGAIGIPVDRVSVKGKTNEGVDAIGRGEAIAAHAVAMLRAG
jgi:2-C-methyl-D-erythritol 4-phosphate cytidylyltransferase/2-C-methyl-D-erythritol 2,4-cyclodiphosphate synthase